MTFWITATIHRRSLVTRYDRMTVVTNNLKHFSNVPGLKVEVWS
jgi:hypothetical protein